MNENERDLILGLFDELEVEERKRLEERLAESVELRLRDSRLRAVVESYRGQGDEEPPDLDLRSLLGAEAGTLKPARMGWVLRLAALLAVALSAFFVGRATTESTGRIGEPGGELSVLREEIARLQVAVELEALRSQDVTKRIAAVEAIVASTPRGPSTRRALSERLQDDENVNVRLAVLDALFAAPELAPSSHELAEVLSREPEVALRLALLDWLAAVRPEGWQAAVAQARANESAASVRRRIDLLVGDAS